MLPTMNRSRRNDTGLRRLSDLRSEVDRLFEDLMGTPSRSATSATWRPASDILETDEAYEIALELPGFDRDDIEVTVDQGVLTVSGRRTAESAEEGHSWHLRERSTGQFSRSFSLPSSVNPDQVSARIDNGVLRVHLPKEEQAKTRKIEVDVE